MIMPIKAMRYPAKPQDLAPLSNHYEGDDRHKDQLLDEALKDSFPASDPPSIVNPR
jgi:hypothetical protein